MYEAPTITEVGSVRDLTLAQGWAGSDDKIVWRGQVIFGWGTDVS